MGTLRKLEREVIRNKCYKRNHNVKSFNHEWEKFHYGEDVLDDDGNVIVAKKEKEEKKKQRHFDNGKHYMSYLKSWKSMVENMKTNKSSAVREKVC